MSTSTAAPAPGSRPTTAIGHSGMVTGTTGAAAIEAGVDVLRKGGSAADAAMATAMTQVCMAAGSWVSYAGILTMVYFDAASGRPFNLNAGYNSFRGETDPASIPGFTIADLTSKGFAAAHATPSGRTALVPGFMAGVEAAHARFGKLPLEEIFAPAIRCAENGIPVDAGMVARLAFRKDVLERLPETWAVFTRADGSPCQLGDTLRQPALAATLRKAAKQGISEYFYKGEWARRFVELVQRDGGKVTLEDLADYQVIWSEPVHGRYHGYDIYTHGMPANGGVNLVEAMNLAEQVGLSSMGPYSKSPLTLYWLAQIAKVAMLMSFGGEQVTAALRTIVGADLSLESRLEPQTSAKILEAITAGSIPAIQPPHALPPMHSDGVVAIDQWGNIASVVHSINTVSWGATGIFVDGISIPDSACFQQKALSAIAPGSRLPDPTSPGLVVKDGQPFMGFSSIGSGLHIRTIGALISVIDFGLTPQEAINEPSVGFFELDATGTVQALTVGVGEFPETFRNQVGALGLSVVENDPLRGYWIGIQRDPKSGELRGGAVRELALGSRAVGY